MTSVVMSSDHPGLTFNLTLVRSEPTYNQPVQQWMFTSDFAVRALVFRLLFVWKLSHRLTLVLLSRLLQPGERLLWDVHSQTDPLYNSPEHGVHGSARLQSERTRHV